MASLEGNKDHLSNLPQGSSETDGAANVDTELTSLTEAVSIGNTVSQPWSESPSPFLRQPSWLLPPLPGRDIPHGSFVLQPVFMPSPSSWSPSALSAATPSQSRAGGNSHHRYVLPFPPFSKKTQNFGMYGKTSKQLGQPRYLTTLMTSAVSRRGLPQVQTMPQVPPWLIALSCCSNLAFQWTSEIKMGGATAFIWSAYLQGLGHSVQVILCGACAGLLMTL